ncbi:Uncharacterized protein Fot_56335 [Forsythia ovata]|uniref:Uncharacterized protein n=1 Tax=Forsythia ovata TaxID=205694 RepID=A0ABD1P3Q1_9LAMI
MMNFNCCELSAFTSVNPQTIITVEKHKQWVTAEMVVSVRANGGIYSARGLPTARNQPHSTSASHRRRKWWDFQREEGPPRGDLQRERAAHSEEPAPQRERESPAAARRKWWEFQREEGPPRGDPQLDWGVHSEEAAPQRECVQRRWLWRSPAVALAFTGGRGGVGDF